MYQGSTFLQNFNTDVVRVDRGAYDYVATARLWVI